jgi:hypothetical protein
MPISLDEAAAFFRASAARVVPELEAVVAATVAGAAVKARGYIGHDQDGWEPLSGATIFGFTLPNGKYIPGKVELGYAPPDNPLLRTGDLRESIGSEAEGLTGIVGSTSKIGLYQELGTANARLSIPPRPFLAKGLQAMEPEAVAMMEEVALSLLVPK